MIESKKTPTDIKVTVRDACEGWVDGWEAFKGVFDEAGGNGGSSTSEADKTGIGARAGGWAGAAISSIRPPTWTGSK